VWVIREVMMQDMTQDMTQGAISLTARHNRNSNKI
jgi:hypothetical protein